MQEDKQYTKDMLKDGKTLVYLKSRFNQKKTKEQRDWLYACIRDSQLVVPMLLFGQKPDFMENDQGERFLPIFSNEEQMPADYREEFRLETMGFDDCVALAKSFPDVKGLVLDVFTEAMMMEYDLAEVIQKIPSRLNPEG